MKKESIVVVKNLSKSYSSIKAVDSISFEIYKDEIFGILGPNGAGKTTTIEMLEGLRSIDAGEVKIDGIDVVANPSKVKQILGIQLQSSEYFDNLSLKEILSLFSAFYNKSVNSINLLEKVELKSKANSKVKELSGGQKQRFSIAMALVNDPKLIFLDEPTTGLDPQARRHMWDLIRSIKEEGKTVILTTHYMEEAEILCDRVAIMDEGKIIAIDSPSNLINSLLKKGFKKEIEVKPANLEDVFIDLTGKNLKE